jgi:hypothetical protein
MFLTMHGGSDIHVPDIHVHEPGGIVMAPLAAGAGLKRVNKQSLLLLECCCLEQNKKTAMNDHRCHTPTTKQK